ncbi:MAG TPA: sigma-70 family RNA polymerase sigma factor [Candidatus Polarisedimenticolia bacterium]|jgi:RNA polymerase sigma-70 factor (ECF subfamily)
MAIQATDADEPDHTLVARMVAGDQEALSCLYDRHRGLVFALALRILRDRAEAEEVLADVYLQAWRGAAGFNEQRGSVSAWLVTLGRSRSIDRLRARGRREAVLNEHSRSEPARAGESGAGEAAGARYEVVAKRRRITQALSTLPPAQRSAIELAYYDGLSHSEIAARLREPLGTIKTRIRQGLMTLRESLDAM